MSGPTVKLTAKELVQQKYPGAFADDDGEWVYIRVQEMVTEICPHCRQTWVHPETNYHMTLSSAGTTKQAWERAAHSLGFAI